MKPKVEQRPIDRIYEEYDAIYAQITYTTNLYPAIILVMFGLLASIWAIPFPHIAFLGKYNGFVNWASFFIAGVVYYCLRLSPVISYCMLFLFFGFSYGIIQLEGWEKSGGWPLWSCSILLLLAGAGLVLINYIKMGTHYPIVAFFVKTIIYGPLWLLVSLCKKFNLKY